MTTISLLMHKPAFWTGLVSAALVFFHQSLGINVDDKTVQAFSGLVVSLILGTHYVAGKIGSAAEAAKAPTKTAA